MTRSDFRRLALALAGAMENSHFGKADFRVNNKIFASLRDDATGVIKLTVDEQSLMATAEPKIFQPVPGGWGHKGWTQISLANTEEITLKSALLAAWRNVAPRSLQG
jgi:hypothetical protein